MKGKLIAFSISDLKNRLAVKFCRKLYGYTDKSYYGTYEYDRPGLLGDIPHVKLIRSVLIVKMEDVDKIVDLMKKFKVEYHVRTVELANVDRKKMKLQ